VILTYAFIITITLNMKDLNVLYYGYYIVGNMNLKLNHGLLLGKDIIRMSEMHHLSSCEVNQVTTPPGIFKTMILHSSRG
jgi:hypothetical protein